jgi:hypothetical protein
MSREEIITANPIVDFVRSRGHELKPAGQTFVTNACPQTQHKRGHRPVMIYPETQSWSCHDCKRGGSVIDWVMIEGNVTAADAMRILGGGNNSSPELVVTYDYTDESGNLLYQTCRYQPKDFRQRRPDGKGGWIWNLEGVRRVRYRLPELRRDLQRGWPVIVVEGEKDADKVAKLGLAAAVTCNPLGAGKWREDYTETLRGANVFVVADKDKNGREHAHKVASSLHGKAQRVSVIELPDREGDSVKDPFDWLAAGGTVDELQDLLNNAPDWTRTAPLRSESQSTEIARPQPFPLHCLPPVCEAMARAVCDTVRVLESLPGCCTLGFLSSAIGAGLQVRSGANRVTRPNLYMLASAESGSGKSETFRHLARPFLEFEAERVADWKEETKPRLLAEHKILEAEIANLTKSGGRPTADRDEIRGQLKAKLAARDQIETQLRTPILSCEDVTGEKLAVLLAHNREQSASLSADALAVVNILLGRYNKLDRTDEGIYLKAFSGDRCKVDRQTRESVLLESPCLSALWLTQPDKLDSLLAERSLSDGGLIPRILLCHTRCEAQEIVKDAPEIPPSVEKAYADLIRSLIETYRLADEPFTIEPTSEALEVLNAHYNATVRRRHTDLRDVMIYAARWNEHAWRIAVVLHAGLHGAHAYEHKLEIDTANRAIQLADWFASQQLEILSASRDKARRDKWDRVLSLADDKPKGIKATDVYRARIVHNADQAHALLAEMEAAGELNGRDEQPETGGHVTRIFTRAGK